MNKALGKNPLLQPKEPAVEEQIEQAEQIDQEDEFVVATFKVRASYLKKLKDFAYTYRLEQKEVLDQALSGLLDKVNDEDLIEYRQKPRKPRKWGK